MTDLLTRLQEAACAAIANERPALEHPVGHVRGLTIELTISSQGQVAEAVCFVERRVSGGALLARRVGKESAA